MSFKDERWSQREQSLGDEAEGHFVEWCNAQPLGYVRSGLDRPPLQMWKLPARIRYTPDFLLTKCYVEVQGFGRDQLYKMKFEKLMALHYWNALHPVSLYVWDSHYQRECFIGLTDFDNILGEPGVTQGKFSEGKAYVAVPGDLIFHRGADAP